MASPTDRLTSRAADVLGQPVEFALRVQLGPAVGRGTKAVQYGHALWWWAPAFLPIAAVSSVLENLWAWRSGHEVVRGVLAFTGGGDRVLLGRKRFRSLRPTETLRYLGRNTQIEIDEELLETYMLPELKIGDEFFRVNGTDFGALTRNVATGKLIVAGLDPPLLTKIYRLSRRMSSGEPNDIRRAVTEADTHRVLPRADETRPY